MSELMPADLTLTAGPNDVHPRVHAAMAGPLLYHYDPVFLERFRRTQAAIGRIFRTTSHDIVLMQGEAILGLEAAARGLVGPGTVCLNLVSGVFGAGFGEWLRAVGATVHEVRVPYDDVVDVAAVEAALDAHPEVRVLSMVHCETPSGTLTPLEPIGRLCRERGVVSVVDAVSSFGGIGLETEAWQLDLVVAGPQKCLGGPPGMSLMAVSPQAWAVMDANPHAPHASFLSILDWRDLWLRQGRFPYTPSVSDVHGVLAAAELLLEEGLERRIERHAQVARACRAGIRAMGLRPWPARESIAAACVTAVTVPDGLTDVQVRDHARARYGVQLSAGQGAGPIIRLGHMGDTARPIWMVAGLAALGRTMRDLGVEVAIGDAIEAAMEVLAEG